MKSDIELLLESQVWKNSSPRLAKAKTLEKRPSKLEPLFENSGHNKNQSSVSSYFREQGLISSPLNLPSSNLRSDASSPMQVPIFPKLPFGIHSKMLKKEPIFKEAIMSHEQLKNFKLESGRIKRIVSERYLKYSPRNGLVQSIRLSLKNCY